MRDVVMHFGTSDALGILNGNMMTVEFAGVPKPSPGVVNFGFDNGAGSPVTFMLRNSDAVLLLQALSRIIQDAPDN